MRTPLALLACALTGCATAAPRTVVRDVVDVQHGTEVHDPYRWLEDGASDEVKAWSAAQTRHARAYLDALPGREALETRAREVLRAETVSYRALVVAGGRLFASRFTPPRNQPQLVVLDAPEHPEAAVVLLDPLTLDASGQTAVDWFVPSPDGRLLAVSLSRDGSEAGDLSVLEVGTGKVVFEAVPRVHGGTAGGALAWDPDSRGFIYTRYPRDGERPAEDRDFFVQLYHHTLGTPVAQDLYELGKDFPRIAEYVLESDPHTGRLLATVQDGDSGTFMHHLRAPGGGWTQITRFEERVVQARLGPSDTLYFISTDGAPRGRILRGPLAGFAASRATVLVPEGPDTLQTEFSDTPPLVVTDSHVFVTYQLGGPSQLRVFTRDGRPEGAPFGDGVASEGPIVPLQGDTVLVSRGGFVEPRAWWRVEGASKPTPVPLNRPPDLDLSQVRVVRERARSKDGVEIPVSILVPPGAALDGSTPFVVTGYGGFGISLEPEFLGADALLLERGVGLAVANLRGGGEFGEAWHRAGNLENKQNVFDDLSGVLDHLFARGYTSPRRVVIQGGSNGGLLMGALLTQHPEKVRAVVSAVGIYDMLRVELSPNGAFNVPEYGSVKDPTLFRAMYAYSPYHHVQPGVAYPAVLFTTGENDPRVDPMQSRKMTARLQAATSGAGPILLRTSAKSGHGMGSSLDERLAQLVDIFAFVLDQVGPR